MALASTRTSSASGTATASRARVFRPDVEGLRALAIVPVLLFHAHEFLAPDDAASPVGRILGIVPGGYLGVDVFFVISGYLITGLLVHEAERTGRVHFGRFYARRARRILPAATATLLVTLVVSYVVLPPARAASAAVDVLWAALFNADVRFADAGVDYMGLATDPSPVLHFWSLNDEEKFYVVWPLVLLVATLLAHRFARHHLRRALFVCLGALAAGSLAWSQHLVTAAPGPAYFSALSRAFELAAGGLLAIAMPRVLRLPSGWRSAGAVIGVVVVAVCMLRFTTLTPFPGVHALPVVLGTLLVLAGPGSGPAARGLAHRVPRWFGRVSYSLYLWHWPVLVLGAAMTASGLLSLPQTLLAVAVSLGLAQLSYRVIEQPPQRSPRVAPTRSALLLGLALVVVTCVAALGAGRLAEARVSAEYAAVTAGLARTTAPDPRLLYLGDSITARGEVPLRAALEAAGWDATIDGLDGRPLLGGAREGWDPLCAGKPGCGADLVLREVEPVPPTVVVALGSNAFRVQTDQVRPPTATDSGQRSRTDEEGRYLLVGQDPPEAFARGIDTVMALVPPTTTVYFVGTYLQGRRWDAVHWEQNNAAVRAAVAAHPNARYLDYAAFVRATGLPYLPDGSHPTPEGMGRRARWIVEQLEALRAG